MKVKGIKITIILSLLASVLMPFSVYADTITSSNIVGVERTLSNIELVLHDSNNFDVYNFNYNFEVLLDKSYIGWINISVGTEFQYSTKNGTQYVSQTGSFTTPNRTYYVNGNSFNISASIEIRLTPDLYNYNIDPARYYNPTYTLNSSNVTEMASIQSLSDITDILNDIESHVDGVETELDSIRNYLEDIVNRYSVDIPSIPIVLHSYYNLDLYTVDGNSFNNYPIFKATQGDNIAQFISRNQSSSDAYRELYFVCLMNNGWSLSAANTNLVLDDGSITNLGRISTPKINGQTWQLVRMTLGNFSSTMHNPNNMIYQGSSDLLIIPIYLNYTYASNYPTDFAQTYNLPNNTELNYLEQLVNATNTYDQSKDDLEDDTSDFVTDSGNLIQIEENYLDNLDTSLQSIDTNTGLNIFGGNFLTSATWVRTQFDRLTYNNPFGSLIVYGMTLGLALLLLGKVML